MFTLRIENDKNKSSEFKVKNAELTVNEDNSGLLLKFTTESKQEITYDIRTDDREKTVNSIKEFIEKTVNRAKQGEVFALDEYLIRNYIYISIENDLRRQFTAHKK